MKNIVLINASPKINEPSASEYLLDMIGSHIDAAVANKYFISVRSSITRPKTREDYAAIAEADAVIIAFPLYIFCLPGILMRFLQDYQQYFIENGKKACPAKVYAIVNCGFPEPGINLEAVRVIRSFCRHVDMHFRFGIMIGGGGMLLGAKDAPFMKKIIRRLNIAFAAMVQDIDSSALKPMDNVSVEMNFPRRLYFFMGDRGWKAEARKNGLKQKDLYRRPYQTADEERN